MLYSDLPIIPIKYKAGSVYENFALESFLAREKQASDRCWLLVWRTPKTIMLGRYQNLLSEVNVPYAQEHHIDIIRRKSGGGCIYTDPGTWQYSLICPERDTEVNFSVFLEPVVAVLRKLGVPAEIKGRNDLVAAGKKISGAAQSRQNGYIIHHGSLLFSTDLQEMVEVLHPRKYQVKSAAIASVRARVTTMQPWLPAMTSEDFGRAFQENLSTPGYPPYTLTTADKAGLARYVQDFAAAGQDLYRQNPAFDLTVEKRFPGGWVQLQMNVHKGIISEARIYGDFFGEFPPETFSRILEGTPYARRPILEALEAGSLGHSLHGITPVDLVDMLPGLFSEDSELDQTMPRT